MQRMGTAARSIFLRTVRTGTRESESATRSGRVEKFPGDAHEAHPHKRRFAEKADHLSIASEYLGSASDRGKWGLRKLFFMRELRIP